MRFDCHSFSQKETLRLHPCQSIIERRTSNQYTLPGESTSLPDGTFVFVSVAGTHHDKAYFENPDKFILDRGQPRAFTYFPYGNGLCIFDKLIEMSLKTVLCELLIKYEIRVVEEVREGSGESFDSSLSSPILLEFIDKSKNN